MKQWPANNGLADFSELIEPLRKAVDFMYDLQRKNADKDVPWDGLNQGKLTNAGCLDADERLTAEMLKYSDEEQGRDPMTELLILAVHLGIEQGRRITLDQQRISIRTLEMIVKDDDTLGQHVLKHLKDG
jgi:hypothetical protein